jgi:hypothetical protein
MQDVEMSTINSVSSSVRAPPRTPTTNDQPTSPTTTTTTTIATIATTTTIQPSNDVSTLRRISNVSANNNNNNSNVVASIVDDDVHNDETLLFTPTIDEPRMFAPPVRAKVCIADSVFDCIVDT